MLGAALAAFFLVSASFFAFAFYDRYWKWRGCIAQAASSCALPGAWNATAGGAVWGPVALVFLVTGLCLLWAVTRSDQRQPPPPFT